ncbi:MAG: hypothetical protein LBV06_09370 [Propionibacteriaceae bacterium]|jgi:hypothetical protein|nr:hypothetical protein [Propionibacteriaceae bacterium]
MTTPDIIAQRALERDGRAYLVIIERPRQVEDSQDWVCTWSLLDDAGQTVVSVDMGGVDSAQALVFAVMIIGDRLRDEGFTWFGLPGTGFPRHVDPHGAPGVISIFADAPEGLFDQPPTTGSTNAAAGA